MAAVLKLSKQLLLYAAAISFIVLTTLFVSSPRSDSAFRIRSIEETQKATPKKDSVDFSDTSLCPRTLLTTNDLMNIAKFKTLCKANHLTRLPPKLSPTANGISTALASMVKRPLGASSNCPRKLRFADFPTPITCLLTFPGSGTTWVRYLAREITGIQAGSVYGPPSDKHPEFLSEGKVKNVIVVKNHKPPEPNGHLCRLWSDGSTFHVRFDRLLILIRNPYAAIVADYKRSNLELGKVGNAFIDTTGGKWTRHIKSKSKQWAKFMHAAFNTSLPVFVMYYEDFKSCLLSELIRLATFLGSEHIREFSFCCVLHDNEGSYHRPASNQTVEDIYSPVDRTIMNEAIMQTASHLKNISYANVAEKLLSYMML